MMPTSVLWRALLAAGVALACGATVTHGTDDSGTSASGGSSASEGGAGDGGAQNMAGAAGHIGVAGSGATGTSVRVGTAGYPGTAGAAGTVAGGEAGASGAGGAGGASDIHCYDTGVDSLCRGSYRVYVCLDSLHRDYYRAIYITNDGLELDCYSTTTCSLVVGAIERHLCSQGEAGATNATP